MLQHSDVRENVYRESNKGSGAEERQHHAPKQLTRKSSSNHRESTRKSAHVHVSGNHDHGHPLQGPRPRLQTSGCRGRCVYARDPSCLATWSHGRMAVDLGRSVSTPLVTDMHRPALCDQITSLSTRASVLAVVSTEGLGVSMVSPSAPPGVCGITPRSAGCHQTYPL